MQQSIQNKPQTSSKIEHLGMFAFLWAIAILWHYLRRPVDYSEFYVLFIPAVLVLTRPKNAYFILAMAAAYIYIFVYELPASAKPNHPTLQMFINLSIVGAALWVIFKNYLATKTLSLPREQWFDTFRPLAIIAINIVYLMAVFAKLNTAFFDPQVSDVTRLFNLYYEADHLLFIPDLMPRATWFLYFGIFATLFMETLIPLCLFIRPLRLLGVFIGLGFHLILSIRLYPSMAEFPTLLFAVYFLALPDTTIPMIRELWGKIRNHERFIAARNFLVLFLAWWFFLLPMVFQWPTQGDKLLFTHDDIWSYSWILYLVIYFTIIIYLLKRTRGGFNEPPDIQWIQPKNAIVYIVPLFIILNGLTPYLGIKNKGSWNMYSGLRTEAGYTNHLFMPNIYITPYMKEVCVVDSSTSLAKTYFTGELFTYYNLLNFAKNNPDARVRFMMDDEFYTLDPISDYPEFSRAYTYLETLIPMVRSGRGFEHLRWCQQYNKDYEDLENPPNVQPVDFTVILWEEGNSWEFSALDD